MARRAWIVLILLTLIGAPRAGAVEVFTFRGETGTPSVDEPAPFDFRTTQTQSVVDTHPPRYLETESGTPWIDFVWGGVAEGPPNGGENQDKVSVIKPDIHQIKKLISGPVGVTLCHANREVAVEGKPLMAPEFVI